MSARTFNRGELVYNIDGQRAEYLMAYEDAHLVAPQYRDEDDVDGPVFSGLPWAAEPAVWHEVFEKPPVPVIHEEVAAARAELETLQKAIREAEAQQRELKTGERERLARLKEHRQLARIDDWLAGKVTHFVVWEHYGRRIEVKTWDAVMKTERRRDYLPLLVLNGTLEWVDSYARMGIDWCITSQGSNNTVRVLPCGSEEEARVLAIEAVQQLTADRMRQRSRECRDGYDHELEDCVKSMQALGMEVPPVVAAAYDESRRAAAQTHITVAHRKMAEATRELAEAEAMARAAGLDVGSAS